MKIQAGFTLIELMIVIVIIAILAAVALPAYNDYIMRGKLTEASTNLSDLRAKMEQYYTDNRQYSASGTPGTCGVTPPACGSPTSKYFTYSCASSTPNSIGDQKYTITATGGCSGGDQSLGGFTYTIDQSSTKTTTIASPANTSKWGTGNAGCWVTKPNAC